MEKVRILEVKQSVFANNDAQAEKLREELKQKGIYLLNLMSSPGSGKTTTLTRLIELLKEDLKIGVMEADIDSDVDAATIAETGARAIQIHTGGTRVSNCASGSSARYSAFGRSARRSCCPLFSPFLYHVR